MIRESLRELITLRLLGLVAASGRTLCVCAAFVSLIDDDEIPTLLPDALANIVLFGVVQRGNYLRGALPRIHELLLVHGREDDVEWFTEPPQKFVLPLNREWSGTQHKNALDRFPEL